MTDGPSSDESAGLSGLAVTVVIPVFNAMPYLVTMLDSLRHQDLPDDAYEVIAVDDGSTDGSSDALDEYALRAPNLTVIHQDNSGWPGRPRNVGTAAARGRYVFFADADDVMGTEALRRMVEFADAHDSDVVVPKMVGVGRVVISSTYDRTAADAFLPLVLRTLTPQKLFRRSMLIEHGMSFPEEKVRLEDGMMIVPAYFKARRVSVLSDYDYYHLRAHPAGHNISSGRLDPEGYTWSIGEVSRLIVENDPDPARAALLVLDLYARKCLKMYEPERFARMPDSRRDEWIRQHQAHIAKYVPAELDADLPYPLRQRSQLLRAGDKSGLLRLGVLERGGAAANLTRARWSRRSLHLEFDVVQAQPADGRPNLTLQLEDRDTESVSRIRLKRRGDTANVSDHPVWSGMTTTVRCTAAVPRALLRRTPDTIVDAHLHTRTELGEHRLRIGVLDMADLPGASRSVKPYATARGNFSIRVRP